MAMTEVFVSAKRYTDEFKTEAVRQVVEHGRSVAEVAERLGITTHSLYVWKRQFGKTDLVRRVEQDEPPRVSRRLQLLRRWSHEQVEQVFP